MSDIVKNTAPIRVNDAPKTIQRQTTALTSAYAWVHTLPYQLDDDLLTNTLHALLFQGITDNASDIHFDPSAQGLLVRMRIDGILHTMTTLPKRWLERITACLKAMAGCDITRRYQPQDGRMYLAHPHQGEITCRLSSLPTYFGEKIVCRILPALSKLPALERIGFEADQLHLLQQALLHPHQLILLAGPAGSGKSTTLYSLLKILAADNKNIITLEDPIEIVIPGLTQVDINQTTDKSFASLLPYVLRQDPNGLMVGEIRDSVTAKAVLYACQTGHPVLASIHSHSISTARSRLVALGLSKRQLAEISMLIVSQRLLRVLCAHCKQPASSLPPCRAYAQVFRAHGCAQCAYGYAGRTAVAECRLFDKRLAGSLSGQPHLDLAQAAHLKVYRGLTSQEEVTRVLGTHAR